MKLSIVALFSLLSINLLLAQKSKDLSPKATEKANQQQFFFAGLEASKSAVAYKLTEIDYLKKTRYPKSLECFVRAAEYYAISEKTGTYGKNATEGKETAIKEADKLFEICDAKGYNYPIALKERIEKLKQNGNSKTPAEEEIVVKEETVSKDKPSPDNNSTIPGGRKIYLDGKVEVFSMVLPEGIELYFASVEDYKMPDKSKGGVAGLKTDYYRKLDVFASNKVRIKDPYFEIQFMVAKDNSQYGQKEESKYNSPGRAKDHYTIEYGVTNRAYGSYKGQMSLNNTESGNNKLRHFLMDMKHKVQLDNGATAYLTFKVRQNLHNREVYEKLLFMFKSFEPVGESVDKPCKTLDEKLLYDKAVKVSYKLFDPYNKPAFIQKPTLERDKVPGAWAAISEAIITAIKRKKTAFKGIGTIENIQNKEKISAFIKQAGWIENAVGLDILGVEFFPAEVSGVPTGNISNVVTFYLNALRASATGASKLEERLNNMAIDLYWEVPYIAVEGLCIPKMICKDGKMVPDYSSFVFEEKSRTPGKFTGNKKSLTLTQFRKELETNFEKSQADFHTEKEYQAIKDKCFDCGLSIYDVTFPNEGTPCDIERFRIKLLTKQIEDEYLSIKINKQLVKDWDGKRFDIKDDLDRQIKIQENLVKANADTISSLQKQIGIQKGILKNYENSGIENYTNLRPYKQAQQKIATYTDEIERLRQLNTQLREDMIENDNSITKIDRDDRGNMLREEIRQSETNVAKLLEERKESIRLREKYCKGKK